MSQCLEWLRASPCFAGLCGRSKNAEDGSQTPQDSQLERWLGRLGRSAGPTRTELWLEEKVGDGTIRALIRCRRGLKFFRKTLDIHMPYRRLPLNWRMIVKRCRKEGRFPRPPSTRRAYTNTGVLGRAAHYSRFASAAYENPEAEQIAALIPGLNKNNIEFVHSATGVACPNFFIAIDQGVIVVAIRGTMRPADGLTNALIKPFAFEGGSAHSGIHASAMKLADIAEPIIQEVMDCLGDKVKVVFVGHSLGGAEGILAAIRIFGPNAEPERAKMMREGRVECFGFGSPPFLTLEAAPPEYVQDCIHVFAHNYDVVPRMSAVAICQLFLAMATVDKLPLSQMQRLRGNPAGHEVPDTGILTEHMEAQIVQFMGNYYHIGNVVLIRRDEDDAAVCEEATKEHLTAVQVNSSMLSDHGMHNYEILLAELAPVVRTKCKATLGNSKFASEQVRALRNQRTILRAASIWFEDK